INANIVQVLMQVIQITLRAVIMKSRPWLRGQDYGNHLRVCHSRFLCDVFETLGTRIFSTRITVVNHNKTRPTTEHSKAVNDSPGKKSVNAVQMTMSRTTITVTARHTAGGGVSAVVV